MALIASAARSLVADASDVELATIATELPDYPTSRNEADTSWLDTAVSVKVPALSDGITDARTEAKAAAITDYKFTQLMSRVNGGPRRPVTGPDVRSTDGRELATANKQRGAPRNAQQQVGVSRVLASNHLTS